MDRNSRRALALFKKAQEQAKRGAGPNALGVNVQPMLRVARADAVDLTKADPSCKRCHGTGLLGTRVIPGNRGCEPTKIPLVCRCVGRGGGVAPPGPRSPSPNGKGQPGDSGPAPE